MPTPERPRTPTHGPRRFGRPPHRRPRARTYCSSPRRLAPLSVPRADETAHRRTPPCVPGPPRIVMLFASGTHSRQCSSQGRGTSTARALTLVRAPAVSRLLCGARGARRNDLLAGRSEDAARPAVPVSTRLHTSSRPGRLADPPICSDRSPAGFPSGPRSSRMLRVADVGEVRKKDPATPGTSEAGSRRASSLAGTGRMRWDDEEGRAPAAQCRKAIESISAQRASRRWRQP
jgi:hypothetical protein